MADIVSSEKRSLMMAGIKGKNTKPELLVRKMLHKAGFRYRLHDKKLAGKPDLVFPKYRAVLFIHGCFWHGHDCHLFKWPSSRTDFWKEKITKNQLVDKRSVKQIFEDNWRVGIVWECALKGRGQIGLATIAESCTNWLVSNKKIFEIRGIK